MRRLPSSSLRLGPRTSRPTTTRTLTSALRPLFRPWGGWPALLRYRVSASGVVRIALTLTLLPLALLDLVRYALATLLALLAALLAVLISASYLAIMLFAVLFSGLVGGAFAVRNDAVGRAWDDHYPGSWP